MLLVDRKHHFPKNPLPRPQGWLMDTFAAHHKCFLNPSILMCKHFLNSWKNVFTLQCEDIKIRVHQHKVYLSPQVAEIGSASR